MDWFKEAKLGIFIHWGLYSVPGYDYVDELKTRKIQNGSEWYMNRLTSKQKHVSSIKTKEYHKENYGDSKYYDFMESFSCENFDADEWCKFIKSVSAKYIVFTSKHHDGFCMWNTKTTDKNIMNTPLKRDVLMEIKVAAKKYGLKFGVYYSWFEFNKKTTSEFIKNVVEKQLNELINVYKPDLFWFDGDWNTSSDILKSKYFVDKIHEYGGIVNGRLGNDCKLKKVNGDYDNFSDRFIPDQKMYEYFESCWTIGLSWGYLRNNIYKTPERMHEIYKKVIERNGNLLLNLGPDATGKFDKNEMDVLIELSKKLENQKR